MVPCRAVKSLPMTLGTLHRLLPALTAAGLIAVSASGAWAAPTDEERAGARAAAYAGVEAFDAGRYQEAVDYFERAESIIHSPVHLSYLGRARVQLGQLVLARETFLKILREEATTEPARNAHAIASAELEKLEARIPSLTIEVTSADGRSFDVEIDGKKLPPALVGIPNPTDPGERHIVVSSGSARAETTIVLAEGAKESVSLELPPAAEGEEEPAVQAVVDTGASSGGGTSGLRVGSYVAFGVGALGLGAGTFFALKASGKNDEASDLCVAETGTSSCSGLPSNSPVARQVRALDDEASESRTWATIGFIAGGVGVATGVTLFVLSLRSNEKEQVAGRRLTPVVGHNYVGLTGTF